MENIRLKYVREVRMGIDAKNLLALDWIVWTLSENKFDCRNLQNIKCENNNDQSIWSYNERGGLIIRDIWTRKSW